MTIAFPHLLSTGSWVHVTMHEDDEFPEVMSGPDSEAVLIPFELLSQFDRTAIDRAATEVFLERRRLLLEGRADEGINGERECG